eukprot:365213-Chlamydomonas_euryale.AAC.14
MHHRRRLLDDCRQVQRVAGREAAVDQLPRVTDKVEFQVGPTANERADDHEHEAEPYLQRRVRERGRWGVHKASMRQNHTYREESGEGGGYTKQA